MTQPISRSQVLSTMFLTCIAFLLFGCQAEEPAEIKSSLVRPAKLITIEQASDLKEYELPAVIAAATSRDMSFQVAGQIAEIYVKGGQEVALGEILATLDQRRFRNDLQSAQTELDAAKLEYERAKRLLAGNAIAQSVYDQRKAQFEVATAQLDSARKSLDDTVLLSPFDGVIAAVEAEELENASPSQTILTIQTSDAAEAIVQIPANLVANSKQIEAMRVVVVLDAAPATEIEASFFEAAGIADEQSQTFEAKFAFTPPESLVVLPGMTGTVRSQVRTNDGGSALAIEVPLAAVQSSGGERYVWVVDEKTMMVSRRTITSTPSVGESLVIKSGLSVGEVIVGAGAAYLHDGMQVRPLEN